MYMYGSSELPMSIPRARVVASHLRKLMYIHGKYYAGAETAL